MRILHSKFIIIAVFVLSCNKPQVQEPTWINAVVEDTRDINCGFPRLNFSEDSLKVREITGEKFEQSFVSKGFPTELNIQGKKVKVLIDNLTPEESFPCLTLGITYPAIKIVSAKER